MRVFGVSLLMILYVLLITACNGRPSTSQPEDQAKTALTPLPAQTTTASAVPMELVDTATIQASPTSQPTLEEPGLASPTAQPTAEAPAATSPTAQSPESTANPQPTATLAAASPACLDEAVFVGDVTIPDGTLFKPGEAFTKTWRVKNTGSCNWNAGYSLVYVSGDIMNGGFNNPITPVAPGELADISVGLVAPARGGEQYGYWEFQNPAGQRFGVGYNGGGPLWVNINVTFFDPSSQPTVVAASPAPASGPAPAPTGFTSPVNTPAAVAASPSAASATTGCTPQQNEAYVQQMLSLINQARAENGLQPVFLQSQLTAAALEHSTDMACNRFVDHDGSDGSTWYGRAGAQGYANPRSARENIYVGADPQGTFNWWMGSQIHRENILFPTVTEAGIGYVNLPGSPYGSYFTLLLARR